MRHIAWSWPLGRWHRPAVVLGSSCFLVGLILGDSAAAELTLPERIRVAEEKDESAVRDTCPLIT